MEERRPHSEEEAERTDTEEVRNTAASVQDRQVRADGIRGNSLPFCMQATLTNHSPDSQTSNQLHRHKNDLEELDETEDEYVEVSESAVC